MSLWSTPDRPVILASKSPRRRHILSQMGMVFQVKEPDLDNEESYIRAEDITGSLQVLARAKAASVAAGNPDALVLGLDTVVVIDGRIMGKPANDDDARGMLRQLSGREHTVFTAVALLSAGGGFCASETAATKVRFRPLTDEEIAIYLHTGDHRDKAGAYGIQERALVFVDSIEGCFYNVVGLPVGSTIRLLEEYGRTQAQCRSGQ